MNIGPVTTSRPIELTPEDVRKAVEEFVKRADKSVVFPEKYEIRWGRADTNKGCVYPDVSLTLSSTEPQKKKPGPKKGSKKAKIEGLTPKQALKMMSTADISTPGPLTKAQAQHILVAMGETWEVIPPTIANFDTWESRLDAVSETTGKNWHDFDDRGR